MTDAVEVGGADALLTGGDAAARRDDLTGEELLHDIADDDEWNRVAEVYMALADEE